MIFSQNSILSDAQAVTATALSTNVYDLGLSGTPYGAAAALESDLGKGSDIYLDITCVEAATAVGAATVTITLETDSVSAMTSSTVLWTSGAIAKATLVAGYRVPLTELPVGDYKQYLALRYTVATGPLTAGKFTAGFVAAPDDRWNA